MKNGSPEQKVVLIWHRLQFLATFSTKTCVFSYNSLLNEIEKFTEVPENIAEVNKTTKYAVFTRYPGEYDDVTKEEYEKAVKTTKECLDWVENKIKESGKK